MVLFTSKRRVGFVSWEWAIFGYVAMSTYAAFLLDVVYQKWLGGRTGFGSWGLLFAGAYGFYEVAAAIERPFIPSGLPFRRVRQVGSVMLLVGIIASIAHQEWFGADLALVVWLLGSLLFLVGQAGMRRHRAFVQPASQPPAGQSIGQSCDTTASEGAAQETEADIQKP